MGVRVLARQDGVSSESPDLAADNLETLSGPSVGGAILASKVPEKLPSMRRKGMEKSVLDDIMGDLDDFRDLGDSDAESDGGRWEDTVREDVQEAVAVEEAVQDENLEIEDVLDKDKVPEVSTRKDEPQPSLPTMDKMLEPPPLEDPGVADQSCSERQHHVSDKESTCMPNGGTSNGSSKHKVRQKRYFIIKSLNHHNIAKSIERGIWATQAMNEPVLNEAFETSEKVLLIFSVNMSGHFQGYAQMISPIGRRRASVWSEANSGANPWGGSFGVEWLRMYDLPFQKTVHLKNPLNSFKPVKISRDCQELTQDIGEALCALIDEGADKEGKPKRKVGLGDAALAKKARGEKSSLSIGGSYRPVVGATPMKGPMTPLMYPATHFAPVISHEPYNPHIPMIRASRSTPSATSGLHKLPRSSRSRSPRSVSSVKGLSRDRDRNRDQHEERERVKAGGEKEHSRIGSGNKSAEFPPEEDLLNMTYEEYLHHHGNTREYNGYQQGAGSFSSYQSAPLYGTGWMGNGGLGMPYSDDQYSNYLANWYGSQQGSMMPSGGYYAAQALANPYPGSQPP